jgi:hypothetical protein
MSSTGQILKKFCDARSDFQASKLALKERISQELQVVYNGGLFKVTPDLISFVTIWDEEELYIEDVYQNPIKVKKSEFLLKLKEAYSAAMNTWAVLFAEIKSIRSMRDV